MRRPRLSVAASMVVVLLVAVDCATVRSPLSGRPQSEALLLLGGLPMANLLVVGLLALSSRHPARGASRYLVGFEVVGWAAFFVYGFAALHFTGPLHEVVRQAVGTLKPLGSPVHLTAAVGFLL